MIRIALHARKMGMTQIYEKGKVIPVTILWVPKNQVQSTETLKSGKLRIQIGSPGSKGSMNKPIQGFLEKNNLLPFSESFSFQSESQDIPQVGHIFEASHFTPGQKIDVKGISKGKGFQGGMKRWNFKGLPASHGVSISHRSLGSTGQRQDPGRVFKGKKMPGHLGHENVTIQNLTIIDVRGDVILVKGAVPGHQESLLCIQDARKKGGIVSC